MFCPTHTCRTCLKRLRPLHGTPTAAPARSTPQNRSYANGSGSAPSGSTSSASKSNDWQTVIGLEIHAQLRTGRKLFSKSPISHNAASNTLIDIHDAAFPGTLPVLDKEAVRLSLLTSLALNCTINPRSTFDRKHYFYHDIPASYQITQSYNPLAADGYLTLPPTPSPSTSSSSPSPFSSPASSSTAKRVRIKQLQIEQDTAKSQTVGGDVLVDLNRAGTGLMEIVTEPDMSSAEEAGAFVRRLQGLLRRIGSGDGDMEKGNLRIDANISVHRPNTPFGVRSEIKNLNSVRFLQTAIAYEIQRHIAHYESTSAPLPQETRQVNELTGETYALRTKEEAMDYRYMPDANLPALIYRPGTIEDLRANLPEMPWVTVERLTGIYHGLEARDVETMIQLDEYQGRGVAYFEEMMRGLDAKKGKKAANWMTHEVLGQLGKAGREWDERVVSAKMLGEVVDKVEGGEMSGTTGKAVVRHLINTPGAAEGSDLDALLDQLGLKPAPAGDLKELCEKAITKCKKEAEMVRKGNEKVAMRLVGEVMKLSQGRADPKKAREIILQILQGV